MHLYPYTSPLIWLATDFDQQIFSDNFSYWEININAFLVNYLDSE